MTHWHAPACAAALLWVALHATAAAPLAPLTTEEVAPGIHVHVGRIADWAEAPEGDVANLTLIVGSRCAAVIDTGGTPALGLRWRATVQALTDKPICHVIHTHVHPDHILGREAFMAENATQWSHTNLPGALAARAPYYRAALTREFGTTLPDTALAGPYSPVVPTQTRMLDLGGRSLELRAWPTAHTNHDLTVWDAATRTLITGDLLFITHLPALDGSLRGWIAVTDTLTGLGARTIVPGHGAVSHDAASAFSPQAAYLATLARETRAAIAAHQTITQAVDKVGQQAASSWQLVDAFHRRNVTTAYAELEWEDE
ncbi:MAG: quinoprotein relay system zinc metallohydrolase 2 [Proteobacteria bacterium]|nr:quinoprotein relay system zinc metallohydrolase 2 [Pseudomonadota bacterium]